MKKYSRDGLLLLLGLILLQEGVGLNALNGRFLHITIQKSSGTMYLNSLGSDFFSVGTKKN